MKLDLGQVEQLAKRSEAILVILQDVEGGSSEFFLHFFSIFGSAIVGFRRKYIVIRAMKGWSIDRLK